MQTTSADLPRSQVSRCWTIATPVALARDGIATSPKSAQHGSIDFDPPCFFNNTLPLHRTTYVNPGTDMYFVGGHGLVLNECGEFDVSGYSEPNFLAWNCEAANINGTVPKLPT